MDKISLAALLAVPPPPGHFWKERVVLGLHRVLCFEMETETHILSYVHILLE